MQRWPTPTMIDLFRLVGALYHRQVKLLKSGLPSKRDMLAINQILLSPLDLSDARSFEESGYLLFLYELGYQLDFFLEQEDTLRPNPRACLGFAKLTPAEQQEALQEAYQRLVLWNEWLQLKHLHLQPSEEHPDTTILRASQLLQARRTLLQHIPTWLAEPHSLEDVLAKCEEEASDLLGLQPRKEDEILYKGIYLNNEEGPVHQAQSPRDWLQVEGAFVTQALRTSCVWLGSVTKDPRSGEWQHAPPPAELTTQASEIIVQSNLDLMLFPGYDQLELLFALEAFCKPLDGEQILRLRIDKKRFFNALQQGKDFDSMCNTLQRASRTPLPANALQLLQSWYTQSNQLVVSKQGCIVEADTDEEFATLALTWPDDLPFRQLDSRRRFVPYHGHERLREWLQQLDKATQQIDYLRPPPKCLRVDSSLHIEVTPPYDLLLQPFLNRVAEPLPAQHGRECYQITAETLSQALARHIPFEAILDFLTDRASVFSSTARLRLETFAGQHSDIVVEAMTIIRTPSPEILERLLHEGGLAGHLLRLGPTTAAIEPEHLEETNRILRSFSLPEAPL